mmetsp:Transcript_13433/g.20257  ORF Transcript_13433/g.20257 Transcript_13433/m.20257 type:complete len:541 (+) Transcript_13433:23-1645(+)
MKNKQLNLILVVILLLTVITKTNGQASGAVASSGDADLFKLLWTKLNDIVTPEWAYWSEGGLPNQIFLMESPGFAVNGFDFDETTWRKTAYSGPSPEYLKFLMTDTAPAFSNYFVDSGFRISQLWEQFMLNARTESPHDDPDRERRYLEALDRLYDENFQPRALTLTRERFLRRWENSFDDSLDHRFNCLLRENETPDVCAQKAVIWKEVVSADWFSYETVSRDVKGTQSQILQLQSSDLHLLLTEAMEQFHAYRRSEVGGTNLFATYYNVVMNPSNWWTWFLGVDDTSAFVSVSFDSSETYTEREVTYDRYFSSVGSTSNFDRPLIRVTSGDPSVDEGFIDATETATSSSISISMRIAKVKVERPWLDLGLLRYSPLAIQGLVAGSWSTGEADPQAMFPLLPTAFIVARDVYLSSTWSSSMTSTLSAATSACGPLDEECVSSVNVQIGPFSIGQDQNQYTSEFAASSRAIFDGQTIYIPGPMIIGWVATKVPYFPNANVDDLATSSSLQSTVPSTPTTGTAATTTSTTIITSANETIVV